MPIIGWQCPVCNHPAPLDHYATTKCGLEIHPDYAQAIIDDRATPHHTVDMVTVTMGVGCPRSRALENSDEPLLVNPLDYNALLIGQAWDEFVLRRDKLVLKGEIAGIPVAGEVDSIRRLGNDLLIEDFKHSNNNQQRFLKKEVEEGRAIKVEYKVQTSIYAELYYQMEQARFAAAQKKYGTKSNTVFTEEQLAEMRPAERPNKGMVWNHYSGAQSSYNRVLWPLIYDTIPLDEALAVKPYGGEFTVLELYRQAAGLYGDTPVKWSDLPLAGKSMMFGKQSMCDYCQVRAKCFEEAQGAPF